MGVEKLHPISVAEDGQVVREIDRAAGAEFILYPDLAAVKWARWRERSPFVPNRLAAILDRGMPVDRDFLEAETDNVPAESHEELSYAA